MKNQHGLNEEKNHIGKKIISQLSACDVTRVVNWFLRTMLVKMDFLPSPLAK